MCFDTTHVYHIKHFIFGVPVKCVGVGAAKFLNNTQVRCGSVRSEKLLCAVCAGVPKLAAHKHSGFNVWHVKRFPTDIQISQIFI